MVDGTQKAAPESRLRSGLAAGLAGFAGVLLLVVGAFQALQGLSAIVRDRLLVLTRDYLYRFDISAWGWIHLVVGLALAAVGAAILSGKGGSCRRNRPRGRVRHHPVPLAPVLSGVGRPGHRPRRRGHLGAHGPRSTRR